MTYRRLSVAPTVALLLWTGPVAWAGPVNPQISVIGQPFLRLTDEPGAPDRDRLRMDAGETELVFEDYLNPFTRGYFTFSLTEEGLELEEGTVTLTRGLPGALNLMAGKYRAGFGKLNPQHPHTYPFYGRFRVLAAYLPGQESFNETGLQISQRLPAPGEMSLVASVDWLQGDGFRRERTATEDPGDPLLASADGDRAGESRPAVLGRLSAFFPVGERSGLEWGLSGTRGTNNVAAGTRTAVLGTDLKAKLWRGERSYLVLQIEALRLDRQDAGWDPASGAYSRGTVRPWGWYLYGDYNFDLRWNVGASCERYRQDTPDAGWDGAVGLFAGFALMEETTAFRCGWERFQAAGDGPGEPAAVNTFTVRLIFSMGPHKAHQF